MGQKVNPIGIRVGIVENWKSKWYANDDDFGKYLVQDQEIREFIRENYDYAGISKIVIERKKDLSKGELIRIYVHTASAGLLIGRRGNRVKQMTEEVSDLIDQQVELKILEVEDPQLDAQLVSESIADALRRRSGHRREMRRAIDAAMDNGAEGAKIKVSGRIGGSEIARVEQMEEGSIPLHTLRARIDYGFSLAVIKKGSIGVKVWINKGEILSEEDKKDALYAEED